MIENEIENKNEINKIEKQLENRNKILFNNNSALTQTFQYDNDKSTSENAEDFAEGLATSKALENSNVQKQLIKSKGKEFTNKTAAKANEAKAENKEKIKKVEKIDNNRYAFVLAKFKGISQQDANQMPNWLIGIFVILYIIFILPIDMLFTSLNNIVCWLNHIFGNIAKFANGFTKTLGYFFVIFLLTAIVGLIVYGFILLGIKI